jgi:enamine deaminase RidA (YjgF/YER057c/UK114 family)
MIGAPVKKTIYNPATLAEPVGHFERAVRYGEWLFISGTSALTNISGPMADRHLVEGVEAQTHETIDNIERVLFTAGGSLNDIYEIRIVLRDRGDFSIVDRVLRERMPARGFIAHGYEGGLLHPEMELELEVKAYLGPTESVELVE